jgi:hypothetical protein
VIARRRQTVFVVKAPPLVTRHFNAIDDLPLAKPSINITNPNF